LVADAFVFISFVFIIQPCDINTNALINCCCRHVSHFAIVFFLLFLAEKGGSLSKVGDRVKGAL